MERRDIKANYRFNINLRLLTVSFTVFALIITLKNSLFQESFLIPMQLVLTIPLLMSSIFARSKLVYTKNTKAWEEFGFLTFLTAYAFLINVVGLLLSLSMGVVFGLIFLIFNIFMSIIYSIFEIIEDNSKIILRVKKDLFFALLLLIGGIIPSLSLL